MFGTKDLSIRNKVILVTTVCSSIALFLSATGFVMYNVRTIRDSKVEQIRTQARMLAFNSTAVLTFQNADAAEKLLLALKSQPTVEYACLIDDQGKQLASFSQREGTESMFLNLHSGVDHEFTHDGYLHLYEKIIDDGNVVGTLFLRANMEDLQQKLSDYGKIVIVVLFCALGVSVGFSLILQRTISRPVVQLATTAQTITSAHDYSIRVTPPSADEIGLLYRSFNQMLEEIEISRKALKASVANMSHEIRTPINAILGFTSLMLRGADRGSAVKRREYLETIQSSGSHLLDLINDILDLSKIEAGQLEIEASRCSPHQILADVVSVLRVRAQEKQLSLEYEWQSGVPESIETDPQRLRQMLINLIGNAIKFTSTGGVRVRARLTDDPKPMLAIDVIDSGIGIPADKLDAIFQPFVQADNSVTRRFGGTGLGLAISRQLATALGGKLSVSSDPQRGSTFTITINPGPLEGVRILDNPIREVGRRAGDVLDGKQLDLTGAKVLVVDDGSSNRLLIDIIVSGAGASVAMAENGLVALELATQRPFDIILMDMQMPVMDGYSATRRLRDLGVTVPILALTANAMKGDEQECLTAGCSGYLTKPIDSDRLLEAISDSLRGRTRVDQQSEKVPAKPVSAGGPLHSIYPMSNPRFRDLARDFVARAREQMAVMREAVNQKEIKKLSQLAHWLKGAGGTAGFPDLTDPSKELEMLAKEGRLTEMNGVLDRIDAILDRIQIPVSPALPIPWGESLDV